MTNGDRIRQMNDEELNNKLIEIWNSGYKYGKRDGFYEFSVDYQEWLESECES